MTDALTKAAQAALDALDNAIDHLPKPYSTGCSNAATDLRAALAAQPVAPVPMPGGIRLTVVERCELIDWRDKCVDDAVSRTLAAAQPQQAAADHPAYQLGFADGAAQYAHKTRGQIREQAAQPVAKPDGRLHADGYFTWARRDGYVLDARLPCDFYLSAQPPAQPDKEHNHE